MGIVAALNGNGYVGRVCGYPDVAVVPGTETQVAHFLLAVKEGEVGQAQYAGTTYYLCKAFGKEAEYIRRKIVDGAAIALSGCIKSTRVYKRGARIDRNYIYVKDILDPDFRAAPDPDAPRLDEFYDDGSRASAIEGATLCDIDFGEA